MVLGYSGYYNGGPRLAWVPNSMGLPPAETARNRRRRSWLDKKRLGRTRAPHRTGFEARAAP